MLRSDIICQVKEWLNGAYVKPLQPTNLSYILREKLLGVAGEEKTQHLSNNFNK